VQGGGVVKEFFCLGMFGGDIHDQCIWLTGKVRFPARAQDVQLPASVFKVQVQGGKGQENQCNECTIKEGSR